MDEIKVTYTLIRFRLRDNLYKRFKIACIQNNLSIPKQMEKFINEFVKNKDLVEIPFEMIDKVKK